MKKINGNAAAKEPIEFTKILEHGLGHRKAYHSTVNQIPLPELAKKNIGSFSTDQMPLEAHDLLLRSFGFNFINEHTYPGFKQVERECIEILGNLFSAGAACSGQSTSGSSEAAFLVGVAFLNRWRTQYPGITPSLIITSHAHMVWKKVCAILGIQCKILECCLSENRIVYDSLLPLLDETTAGVIATLGTTVTGAYEPINIFNNELKTFYKERGIHIPLHIDAASGGFIAPFVHPNYKWDFKLEHVSSINTSGHKYGQVYPGLGWLIWNDKSADIFPLNYTFDYLLGEVNSSGINLTKTAAHIILQRFIFQSYGRNGFISLIDKAFSYAKRLRDELEALDIFNIFETEASIPVITWSSKYDDVKLLNTLSAKLLSLGWSIPTYKIQFKNGSRRAMRVVMRSSMNEELLNQLVKDIRSIVKK